MGSAEKFCLRWNDFENNISSAFRELREDKDFFDVTIACDEDQIQAHKVIVSACSPFFRTVLRRNKHEHPLLYLKGVKYGDLVSVLNFMYHGEVNIAQEDLNTFLSVAEDLKVKGLTQTNQETNSNAGGGEKLKPKLNAPVIPHTKQQRRPTQPQPQVAPPRYPAPDDDIQEIMPVKSEPVSLPPEPIHSGEQKQPFSDEQQLDMVGQEGEMVEYGEDYGQYYDQGEDVYDGYGVGGPAQDGNKELDRLIAAAMSRDAVSREWNCNYCSKSHKDKARITRHVEVHFPGYSQCCVYCGKELISRNALRNHISDVHTKQHNKLRVQQS